jgi:putative DNA methylase
MIPKECKRLAEVDFPIAVVSKHSAREKSIRHGHPSTLHLWWARRPLAACRAMLLALLLPDPCDSNCSEEFKQRARNILPRAQGAPGVSNLELRNALLRFIGDFADWDNASNPTYLEAARGLVRAAHGEEAPLVVDPFAGGGSIPLEALRLGCDTFASDLNPVAGLILKTMLVEIANRGRELATKLRESAREIQSEAESRITVHHPAEADGARPLTYLWAKTVVCDTCGAELPLVRTCWLSKRSNRKRAIRFGKVRDSEGKPPHVDFEIFEPMNETEVPLGTVTRARATCPICHTSMPPQRLRVQLTVQHGGANPIFDMTGRRIGGARLIAVVVERSDGTREFRSATAEHYAAFYRCVEYERKATVSSAPTEKINPVRPSPNARGLSAVTRYGVSTFADLFNSRQRLALMTLAERISVRSDEPCAGLLASVLSRCADYWSSCAVWSQGSEFVAHTFGRQALPMVWDYAECVPFAKASGSYGGAIEWVATVAERLSTGNPASVEVADACCSPLPDSACDVWFTDPPYYDAIPYADLSDFFYVWLKRALPNWEISPALRTADGLTPKLLECVWNQSYEVDGKPKDGLFFERTMFVAFCEGRRVLAPTGIASIVFAHKTTEGWEALLSGIIRAGWVITASWPIATERSGRLQSKDSASLATSVHLVCRPRPDEAPIGDWAEVLRKLPVRVGDWIEKLQGEGVRGADLVFACIGPAMEVYSRYRRVEDAEGREIPLGGDPTAAEPYKRGFLAYVWETVGRMALEQVLGTAEAQARNGGAGALEEDSRLTALFLWTLQATDINERDTEEEAEEEDEAPEEEDGEEKPKKKKSGYTLIYDVARRFAQPLGIHLDKWEGRIIETHKGVVRLLPVAERTTLLFGDADAAAMSRRIEQDVKAQRNYTFAFMQDAGAAPEIKARKSGKAKKMSSAKAEVPAPQQVTTLDRVHAAMLLQAGGQTNGLRALLREEQQRGPDFVRLANALSALYPKDSEEKRLLDAMLLAVPRS